MIMAKNKLKNVAKSLLTEAEYAEFKSVFKSFQSSKCVDFLCTKVVPFVNTPERLELLTHIRQNIPNNLRGEFTYICRSMLKDPERNLRKRDSVTESEHQSNHDQRKSKKSNSNFPSCDWQNNCNSNQENEEKSHWLKVSYKERYITVERPNINSKFGFAIRGGKDQAGSIFVSDVEPRSLADLQGLQVGDRIIRINELDCKRAHHSDVVHVIRSDNCLHMKVLSQVLEREHQDEVLMNKQKLKKVVVHPDGNGCLGCSIRGGIDYSSEVRVISIEENSPAERAGLKIGNIIVEVNGINISRMTHVQVIQLIILSGTPTIFSVKTPEPDVNTQGGNHGNLTRRSQSVSSSANRGGHEVGQRRQSQSAQSSTSPPTSLWVQCHRSSNARGLPSTVVTNAIPPTHAQLPSYSSPTPPAPVAIDDPRSSPPPPYSREVPSEHHVLARGIPLGNDSCQCVGTNECVSSGSSVDDPPSRHTVSVSTQSVTDGCLLTNDVSSGEQTLADNMGLTAAVLGARNSEISQQASLELESSNDNVTSTEQTQRRRKTSVLANEQTGRQRESPVTCQVQAPKRKHSPVNGHQQEYNIEQEDIPTTVIDIGETSLTCDTSLPPSACLPSPDMNRNYSCTSPVRTAVRNEIATEPLSPETSYLHLSPSKSPSDNTDNLQQTGNSILTKHELNSVEDLQSMYEHSTVTGENVYDIENRILRSDGIMETNIDMGQINGDVKNTHSNNIINKMVLGKEMQGNEKPGQSPVDINPHQRYQNSKVYQEDKKVKFKPSLDHDSIDTQIRQFDKKKLNQVKVRELYREPLFRSDCDKYGRTFCYELTFDDVEVMMLNDDRDDTAPSYNNIQKNSHGSNLLSALNYALEERGKVVGSLVDGDHSDFEWEV